MERTERHRIDGDYDDDDAVIHSVRLIPFTRHSLQRLKDRNIARKNHRDCRINLPECELVSVSTSELIQPKIFNIPLEDVSQFGTDKTFCVLVERSHNQYLYRFSAENSLFIFSPWSRIRIFAIRISCHRFFELFVMTTILLNCVFLALSHPIEETEYVFLVIYTVEMAIKAIAKGFALNKYAYLRNPWNWLDFVVVLSGYITLGLHAIGLSIGNLAGLRTFRVLRALKTVSITPGLKTIVNAMLHSIGMLAEVMTLTVFCLMVFALLALQLYNGVLHQKCVLDIDGINPQNASDPSSWLIGLDGQPVICGTKVGTRYCPNNYTCTPGVGDNPNYGYTSFDSYGWALLTTFQLITLDFWEDIYNKINDAAGPASLVYFMIVVFFGSFYLINLTLAVVAIAYEEEAATTLKEQDRVKKISTGFPAKLARTLAAINAKRKILPAKARGEQPLEKWCTPRKNISAILGNSEEILGIKMIRENKPSCSSSSTPQDKERKEDGETGNTLWEDPHPLCMGAPDIIISTGAKLPTARVKDVAPYKTQSPGVVTEPAEISDIHSRSPRPLLKRFQPHLGKICQEHWAVMRGIYWLRRFLEKLVNDPLFDLMITVCILLNTAFLSVEHHGMSTKMERILRLGNLVFAIVFCLEAAGKLLALGRDYFRSKWNVFDMVVVGLSLADLSFETVSGLSVLRTFRLLRVVKLAQAWPTMRLLLTIIASTLGAVGNMTLVLAVIVYVFAILGVQLFSDFYTAEKFAPDPVPRWNFTDFFHSLLMVFRILCGEWVQPLWDCMRASEDKYQVCIVLFLAALTVGNFLVLNLFLAMLLNSFNTQQLQETKEKTASDSKVLRGFQRIKGVICGNNASILSGNSTPLREGKCRTMSRRWSEPGTPLRLATSYRRPSDVFHSVPVHLRKGDQEHLYHRQFAPLQLESFISSPTSGTLSHDEMQEEGGQLDESGNQENGRKMKKKKTKIKDTLQPPPCCPVFCTVRFSTMCSTRCLRTWDIFRRTTLTFVDHKSFEWGVLFLIFASSVVLVLLHLMTVLRRCISQRETTAAAGSGIHKLNIHFVLCSGSFAAVDGLRLCRLFQQPMDNDGLYHRLCFCCKCDSGKFWK